ncbi:PfkB family carbohydrate kinase [Mycobacteroides abscessus]
MIIVGGIYHEMVTIPSYEGLFGSGLRAAAALSSGENTLVGALDEASASLAGATIVTLRVTARTVRRDQPVRFRYMTPMSSPAIDGPSATLLEPLIADDDTVLAFGTVEQGNRQIRGDRVVFDPQQPRGLQRLDTAGIDADQLVVIANAREARALARGEPDLVTAARRIGAESGAAAVIIKDSARGCLVAETTSESFHRIGSFPTQSVWPLGSGDVFAAGFTHAWHHGADFAQAARVGSASAAWWAMTTTTPIPSAVLAGENPADHHHGISTELDTVESAPLIYLAGPFFALGQRWLVETCRAALAGLGVRVFSPLHEVGPGGDEVAIPDLEGLDQCTAVLALLDGWDPGTVYEVGWARHLGIPAVGLLNDIDNEGTKMLVGTGVELHQDLSTALYRAAWASQGLHLLAKRIPSRPR